MGHVKLKDWYKFAKYGIGCIGILLSLLTSAGAAALLILITFVVGQWADQSKEDQQNSDWYHYFYGAILLYILISFLRCLVVALT